MQKNGYWLWPESLAARAKTLAQEVGHLGETRPDMTPEVNGWIAMLEAVAAGLSEYAESCHQLAAVPAEASGDGICPPVGLGQVAESDGVCPPIGLMPPPEHVFRG